jgi:hypothetical protein
MEFRDLGRKEIGVRAHAETYDLEKASIVAHDIEGAAPDGSGGT